MALKLLWLTQAADDLASIHEYLAERESADLATQVCRKIYQQVEATLEFPQAGRMVPEYARMDLRERIVGRYRLLYLVQPGCLKILSIWHSSRPLPDVGELLK